MDTSVTDGHLFWIASRASGTAALLFSSVAVGLGLTMALKLLRGRGPVLLATHEALSLATMIAIGVHVFTLLGDSFAKFSVVDLTVPFVSGYREPWMSIGILAGWVTVILGLSYYARKRIGVKRWRRWHRFTSVAWVAAVVHSLGEGTDAGLAWFVVALGVAGVPAVVLLAMRWLTPRAVPVAR
jgi:sulfoxide reductase heme-binding subunit YedZ